MYLSLEDSESIPSSVFLFCACLQLERRLPSHVRDRVPVPERCAAHGARPHVRLCDVAGGPRAEVVGERGDACHMISWTCMLPLFSSFGWIYMHT